MNPEPNDTTENQKLVGETVTGLDAAAGNRTSAGNSKKTKEK